MGRTDRRSSRHGVAIYVEEETYGADGNRVLQRVDDDGDGDGDGDGHGDGDGTWDSLRSSAFDDSNNELEVALDDPAGGTLKAVDQEGSGTTTHTYDADGELVKSELEGSARVVRERAPYDSSFHGKR